MKIKLTLKDYLRQLQLMNKQYAQEEALYPWIYMLLQMTKHKDVSIQLIAKASNTKALPGRALLGGYSPFPDIVILDEYFDTYEQDSTKQINYLYGCVECKSLGTQLPDDFKDEKTYTVSFKEFLQIKPNTISAHYYYEKELLIHDDKRIEINFVNSKDETVTEPLFSNDITKLSEPSKEIFGELINAKAYISALVDVTVDPVPLTNNNITINNPLNWSDIATFYVRRVLNVVIEESGKSPAFPPHSDNLLQLMTELLLYGKVIHTNGFIWKYYKIVNWTYASEKTFEGPNSIKDLREKILNNAEDFSLAKLSIKIKCQTIAELCEYININQGTPNHNLLKAKPDINSQWQKLVKFFKAQNWKELDN